MIIGTDLDDVLTDFVGGLAKYLNKFYGTSFTRDDFYTFDLQEVWGGTREEAIQKVLDFYRSDFFKNLKPFEDAQEAVNLLSQKHEMIIITSRPRFIEKETVTWVEKYFPGNFSKIYFAKDHADINQGKEKLEICEEVNVDVLIDDCLEHLTKHKNNTRLFLYDAPWNRNKFTPNGIERVKSWKEIVRKIG